MDLETFHVMNLHSEEEDDDIPLKFISLARQLFNYEYHELSDVDKQLATSDIRKELGKTGTCNLG